MSYVINNKKLKAEISLPSPFTGQHYAEYTRILQADGAGQTTVLKHIAASLSVLEKGSYEYEGASHDLKAEGENADLAVLNWLRDEVRKYVDSKFDVPKG